MTKSQQHYATIQICSVLPASPKNRSGQKVQYHRESTKSTYPYAYQPWVALQPGRGRNNEGKKGEREDIYVGIGLCVEILLYQEAGIEWTIKIWAEFVKNSYRGEHMEIWRDKRETGRNKANCKKGREIKGKAGFSLRGYFFIWKFTIGGANCRRCGRIRGKRANFVTRLFCYISCSLELQGPFHIALCGVTGLFLAASVWGLFESTIALAAACA